MVAITLEMTLEYKRALGYLLAGLAIKIVLITLLTVRGRLQHQVFFGLAEDSNTVTRFLLDYPFKLIFCVFPLGPQQAPVYLLADASKPWTMGIPGIEIWNNIHRNCVEQEPFFAAVAVAYGLIAPADAMMHWAALNLYTFLGLRTFFMIFYSCRLQPFRTLTFTLGLVSTLFASYLLIAAAAGLHEPVGDAPKLLLL
jgi:uncharacterized MAPEG superfamily protein